MSKLSEKMYGPIRRSGRQSMPRHAESVPPPEPLASVKLDPAKPDDEIVVPKEWGLHPRPAKPGGWQPIATAPKDYSTVLTIHRDDLYPVAAYFMPDAGWLRETEGPEDVLIQGRHMPLCREPTHWMPLPEPPR